MTQENTTAPASADGLLNTDRPNLALGLAAGAVLGLVAAAIYAGVAVATDREIGYLALLIGLAVGFGVVRFGRRTDMLTGIIATVIAIVMFLLAVLFALSGVIANEFGIGFGEVLGELMKEPFEVLKLYFEEDLMGYVFLLLAAAPAFVMASGVRNQES